ncbi:hypothetical protein MATL_G00016640 [Megalops atlanticus]|uniref:Uncharacterized protein n=1 Tax=Megalops atlanticus TaxID=7932 RepID=A0A9D3QIU4_MEGAT|nr:hypothetical protein MATL_G00016640 [Megalops atlanticus]
MMDYMISVQNKRRLEDLENLAHFHQNKRLCNGLASCSQVECGAVGESPMDTWEIQQQGLQKSNAVASHHETNLVYTPQGVTSQFCPRCMAGESGHIKHIMGC